MRTLLPVLALATMAVACAADLPLKPFSYTEGFESNPPPVALWASRGTPPTINFLGPSTDKASEGKQSLKIDVTFGDSPYYYFALPLRVPCAGKLKLSARLWLLEGDGNSVGFGTNVTFPPTTESSCGPFEPFDKPTGGWKLIEVDMVCWGRRAAEGLVLCP